MKDQFFSDSGNENLDYYQMPKVLMCSDRYIKLTPNAFKLYIVLHERMQLSMQNGWKNEEGSYYVSMAPQEAEDLFNYSTLTFEDTKIELEMFDLLYQEKHSSEKLPRLYIKKCKYTDEELLEYENMLVNIQ
ncbi:hypothetical protein BU065_12750 [Staphylococcus succinus]|uniref:Replication initiator A N-terminal domain-containing protein n=2 Tax=Staphylococcus succinus TaxID=61015 RepID=A0A9Q6HM74_9STAP|nr:replication initiator protein A [Staphylococcus succinus]MEB8126928.1 replication initiator protein A [Staphylococcus succinus]MEB8209014.1 replication initiator protein A [Staphylococcus succinus]PTI39455.1 hypothetical protein BU062_11140 [Staphylococcus succinus]PTI69174.1 hypothetical protein BU057_06005 [Staphylococcus succinus]PTI73621.1 hypothetical protein BU058_13010 [Staphylococcus succinus]